MALRPPRGHFTDLARQWRSAFMQRFLKAAVIWWKRRSWRRWSLVTRMLCSGQTDCGLRPESLYQNGDKERWRREERSKPRRVVHVVYRCREEWAEREKANRSVARATPPWRTRWWITEMLPSTFVMAHNQTRSWHLNRVSIHPSLQSWIKEALKKLFSTLICSPLRGGQIKRREGEVKRLLGQWRVEIKEEHTKTEKIQETGCMCWLRTAGKHLSSSSTQM